MVPKFGFFNFFYLFQPNFELPAQFGGFQTLSYDFQVWFGTEINPKSTREAMF